MDCRVTSAHSPVRVCATDDAHALRSMVANTTIDPRNEIEQHLAAMRAFALVLAGERALADDIVALTVIEAWSDIEAAGTGRGMRARLFRMLRNAYYAGHCRPGEGVANRKLVRVSAPDDPDDVRADGGFRRVFYALPDEQREALILVGAEAFSLDDAAGVCGCSPATIRNRVKLGRRKLGASTSRRQARAGMVALPARLDRAYGTALPDAQNRMEPVVGDRSARGLHPETGGIAAAGPARTGPRLVPAPDQRNAPGPSIEGDKSC